MKERLIVIGGVAAGLSGASKFRRLNSSAAVDVFERGHHISYSACGIPYYLMGKAKQLDDLVVYNADFFRKKRDIQVHLHHEAEEILPSRRVVKIRDLKSGTTKEHPYTRLIIATGAAPVTPSLEGADLEGVYSLRDLSNAEAIKQYLHRYAPGNALVVGAGYIGMEMAEVFHSLGMNVTVVEMKPKIQEDLHEDLRSRVEETLAENGVRLITSRSIKRFEGSGRKVARAVLSDGETIETGIVLLATGIRPETRTATGCGIETGATGAIRVNSRQETSVSGIYAAGDCAEHYHRILRRPAYIPLGTTANKQGKIAGANAAGFDHHFAGITGTSVFKVFDLTVARTGIDGETALKNGFAAETVSIRQSSKAFYFPGADKLSVALTGDSRTGKLLGVQMVGRDNVAKRIDSAAVALFNEMDVKSLYDLDLSYAPPFAPSWEGMHIAAEVWYKTYGR